MNEYRAQKDKLEMEAMKRNPETAYLVDKEAFDNKLDELGALDAIEACGMYVDRAMYNMKKSVQDFSGNCWNSFSMLRHWSLIR